MKSLVAKSLNWAHNAVAIVLLVDGQSFSSILLVVSLRVAESARSLAQRYVDVSKEYDVLDVELDHLFGVVV